MRKRNGNLGSLVCSNTQSPLGLVPPPPIHLAHRQLARRSWRQDRTMGRLPWDVEVANLPVTRDQRSHQLKPVKMDGSAENSGPMAPRILGSPHPREFAMEPICLTNGFSTAEKSVPLTLLISK